mmetsp:Transcript_52938/g.120648  ORF Transcript_52938/g.120648 Transcript_52938/m.120648 type:complete len:207 (-) Transcript_52938:4055-4675(-)
MKSSMLRVASCGLITQTVPGELLPEPSTYPFSDRHWHTGGPPTTSVQRARMAMSQPPLSVRHSCTSCAATKSASTSAMVTRNDPSSCCVTLPPRVVTSTKSNSDTGTPDRPDVTRNSRRLVAPGTRKRNTNRPCAKTVECCGCPSLTRKRSIRITSLAHGCQNSFKRPAKVLANCVCTTLPESARGSTSDTTVKTRACPSTALALE